MLTSAPGGALRSGVGGHSAFSATDVYTGELGEQMRAAVEGLAAEIQ